MRRVKITEAFEKVAIIRKYVFEKILFQIASGNKVDFSSNIYLERILKLRVKTGILQRLISNISKKDAKKALKVFFLQNKQIVQDIYTVQKHSISESILRLAEYIYDDILFYSTYWNAIDKSSFSKMSLKTKIFEMQGNCICPYCDSDEDLSLLSFEIDHLLPKSDFPMLYISEMNLFPCCQTCNDQHYGKGNRHINKYHNLHKTEIGLKTQFSLNEKIKISGSDNISDDYISLIKLEKRHNQSLFITKIENLEKKIKKDLKKDIRNKTFLEYNAPHYYLIKELYKKCLIEIKQSESKILE